MKRPNFTLVFQRLALSSAFLLQIGGSLAADAAESRPTLSAQQATALAQLPLDCVQHEYPNKLGQVLSAAEDMGGPRQLHPAFFGCFDWHSAVHGHWSLVRLLKLYPQLEQRQQARAMLAENMSAANMQAELAYFHRDTERNYERTYGWAWLLKLQQELDDWDDPLGVQLARNLQPLTDLLVQRYVDYLPRLVYPVRVGVHTNTAFGLSFAWDYGKASGKAELLRAIETSAREFFLEDRDCPLGWEPSGTDFLSPCFEELNLMRRVLPGPEFEGWLDAFLPQLAEPQFALEPGQVRDREDGNLVHLDGLNFSRAWVLYGLIGEHPNYGHLSQTADAHIAYSLPSLFGDSYEGGHWLGSFAIYALDAQP